MADRPKMSRRAAFTAAGAMAALGAGVAAMKPPESDQSRLDTRSRPVQPIARSVRGVPLAVCEYNIDMSAGRNTKWLEIPVGFRVVSALFNNPNFTENDDDWDKVCCIQVQPNGRLCRLRFTRDDTKKDSKGDRSGSVTLLLMQA
jgi:hypothetical protein